MTLADHTDHEIHMDKYHSYAKKPVKLAKIIVHCLDCDEILGEIE